MRDPTAKETLELAAKLVKADGCTSAPDFWFTACCNEHDIYYRTRRDPRTGKPVSRREADKRLRQCMRRNAKTFMGRWFIAPLYWGAVRLFGGAFWKHQQQERNDDGTAARE